MPSPAEIVAALVSRHELEQQQQQQQRQEEDGNNDMAASTEKSRTSTPSITDKSAFPALGTNTLCSSPKAQSPATWGPKMKAPPISSTPVLKSTTSTTAASKTNGNGYAHKAKTSTIQEAFSLDIEDQLNVTRPEFIKILTFVMQETKTSIECTNSQHTKKRTFLITGKPEEVKLAKRLVIKKLTKPVKIKFLVPAKLRSRIIGQGGKNLKPIISVNEVKIEIGDEEEVNNENESGNGNGNGNGNAEADDNEKDDDDDIFSKTVQITIDGDIEGSKRAKNQILAIVKEETKNLSSKVALNDIVKPFANAELKSIVEKYPDLDFSIPDYKSSRNSIVIVGDRESVLEAKSDIKAALEKLNNEITVEEVPIPKTKHQFLPIDDVLEKCNVLIQLPKEDEQNVKFVGEKENIKQAQEEARKVTSQYKVEILDMSKAHKGNLKHVKAVAVLLNKTGAFKQIGLSNDVTINVPSAKVLQSQPQSQSYIPIEIVSKGGENNIKAAKKAIVNQVNKITPDQTKTIDDIDEFFFRKIDEKIKELAKTEGVDYVVLGNIITLFKSQDKQAEEEEEAEDFDVDDDVADSNSTLEAFNKVDSALDELRQLATRLTTESLGVTSNDLQAVSGPKGTTLKSILASVEPNTAAVEFGENVIRIHGINTSVAVIKKEIEAVLAEAKEYPDGYFTTISIPSQVVSRLIGKNGSFLNSLRDEFGVKIDVPLVENGTSNNNNSNSNKRDEGKQVEVTIRGVKKNVEEAKLRILSTTKKWADETLVRLKVENQYHRRIIGAQGIYINRLQDKYNVRIRFPSPDAPLSTTFSDAPKSKDEVTIKGPSKGVAKASEELQELYQFEKENGFKQTLKIPSKAISRVIGKSGGTIKDIADGTGVEYKFKRDDKDNHEEKDGYVELELTGSKSGLKESVSKIQEIIDEIENFTTRTIKVEPQYHRDLVGPYGSIMKQIISQAGGDNLPRNKYNRLLTIPNEGSGSDEVVSQGDKTIVDKIVAAVEKIVEEKKATVVEELELAKEKHRFIIGPGGSIRSEIEREYKVGLNIPRKDEESSVIKIKGLPESIELAKAKIEELTKDKKVGGSKRVKPDTVEQSEIVEH
ncbi:SCP160 [Candida oxycetoniae]|uniref:SCP160 n=1 Tax=Candida oxycetoniae TaxID=497107 RepID=A0AAI9STZ9_9ASCO|nr:SCP160 [Candida oxycetoniae]KAI3403020.2 SCP160 [Candida oxycetoniae]